MAAAAARYGAERGVEVVWDARPLAAFNDQPLSEVPDLYDLVFVDHPTIGAAAAGGRLFPLEEALDARTLAALEADSIGASQHTYVWDGRTWAVGVDAACQVAAYRPDLLQRVPASWQQVIELAGRHPGSVAMPLYPSDAMCSLLSLSAQFDPASAPGSPAWPHPEALDLLCRLSQAVDAACFELNPPQLLDRLAAGATIAYTPLIFGYTNYSRPGQRVRFCDLPSPGGEPGGGLLGGAGLAVPATGEHPAEAARFAAWCARPAIQREVILPNGGQPASRAVWDDPACDAAVGGFFTATRKTMDTALVRPRAPWWPGYALKGSLELHRMLADRRPPAAIASALARLLEHRS
jgi:multiple sugar transport system substrate-binding protein